MAGIIKFHFTITIQVTRKKNTKKCRIMTIRVNPIRGISQFDYPCPHYPRSDNRSQSIRKSFNKTK